MHPWCCKYLSRWSSSDIGWLATTGQMALWKGIALAKVGPSSHLLVGLKKKRKSDFQIFRKFQTRCVRSISTGEILVVTKPNSLKIFWSEKMCFLSFNNFHSLFWSDQMFFYLFKIRKISMYSLFNPTRCFFIFFRIWKISTHFLIRPDVFLYFWIWKFHNFFGPTRCAAVWVLQIHRTLASGLCGSEVETYI